MIEAILGRLSPLGLVLRPTGRGPESARLVANPGGNAWRLHAMLIDTMLDLAGLEYDAVDRRMTLQPVLPGHLAADRDLPRLSLRPRHLPAREAHRRQRPPAPGRG